MLQLNLFSDLPALWKCHLNLFTCFVFFFFFNWRTIYTYLSALYCLSICKQSSIFLKSRKIVCVHKEDVFLKVKLERHITRNIIWHNIINNYIKYYINRLLITASLTVFHSKSTNFVLWLRRLVSVFLCGSINTAMISGRFQPMS